MLGYPDFMSKFQDLIENAAGLDCDPPGQELGPAALARRAGQELGPAALARRAGQEQGPPALAGGLASSYHMCSDMCTDMCINSCKDMCIHMRIDLISSVDDYADTYIPYTPQTSTRLDDFSTFSINTDGTPVTADEQLQVHPSAPHIPSPSPTPHPQPHPQPQP